MEKYSASNNLIYKNKPQNLLHQLMCRSKATHPLHSWRHQERTVMMQKKPKGKKMAYLTGLEISKGHPRETAMVK